MSKILIFSFLFILGCSTHKERPEVVKTPAQPKEFARGEVILATQLLTKIFDEEMSPLECVPDKDEAELLLRTIRPRMEVVQDDLEALLDDNKEVDTLIKSCQQNCTCEYVDELLREHLVKLTDAQRKTLAQKKTPKELSRCMNFVQTTFCQSDLYKTLDAEKADFTYEGEN